MSYLNNLRLTFAGDFQSDVSTVNNDVRNYDNATFEPRFQDPQVNLPEGKVIMNGWWNPTGSGAFRLLNCKVKSVVRSCKTQMNDPALGLFISGSDNRVGGKMVDLDPQMQMVSALWGLTVRLTDGKRDFLVGQFEPSSFRDIMFGRRLKKNSNEPMGGSSGASAIFQSVLTDLEWDDNLTDYPFLEELKRVSPTALSIQLTTWGYDGNSKSDRFTLGTVVGAIGPHQETEPRSFVLGRRMVPTSRQINFFDSLVDESSSSILVNLGNALPLTFELNLQDIGNLQLGILSDDGFDLLGDLIPYQEKDWLYNTAGIFSISLSPDQLTLIKNHPLVLIQILEGEEDKVLAQETTDGLLIRADDFVQRIEAGEAANVQLFASRYGKPLPNAEVEISFSPPSQDGGSGNPNTSLEQPIAKIPDTDWPTEALTNLSKTIKEKEKFVLTTNGRGHAELPIATKDPGNPRVYLDGQIYRLQYSLNSQPTTQQAIFDRIIILLFDSYTVPEKPTWFEHIQPIFQQYGNLYPIMSKRLVDLGDYDSVRKHRSILELAFALDINDPNSMPVTRDLSKPRRATILRWLREQHADGSYVMRLGKLQQIQVEALKPVSQEASQVTLETASKSATSISDASISDATDDNSPAHGYENYLTALRERQAKS